MSEIKVTADANTTATTVTWQAGYTAGVEAERVRIVALLQAEAEAARAKRYWDFVDAYERSAAVIERAS